MMITLSDLPLINAILNATSAVFLSIGMIQIKQKRIDSHRNFMLLAFATSTIFLMSYVIYHGNVGSKPYPGHGIMRGIYFTILIPHVILAATVLPLSFITLFRGLKMDVERHRRIAKITFPIWLFVSVTGVLVYLMLYQF
jgi:uncharacterized membrane protein YozB (DUF420 family)